MNGWKLEYDCFLLGETAYFQGRWLLVSGRVRANLSLSKMLVSFEEISQKMSPQLRMIDA